MLFKNKLMQCHVAEKVFKVDKVKTTIKLVFWNNFLNTSNDIY